MYPLRSAPSRDRGAKGRKSITFVAYMSWKGHTMLQKITSRVIDFLANEDGPTAVEYAVMLALIIVVCIVAISTLGSNANNTFSYVATQVGNTSS